MLQGAQGNLQAGENSPWAKMLPACDTEHCFKTGRDCGTAHGPSLSEADLLPKGTLRCIHRSSIGPAHRD